MISFLRTFIPLVLGIVVPLGLQLVLSGRMSQARRDRGWSRVSWAFALYAIGPLSMIPFCWVTRRWRGVTEGLRALGVGLLWTIGIFALIFACDLLYAFVLGLPLELS